MLSNVAITGQLSKVIDPVGNEVSYTYDQLNRLQEVAKDGQLLRSYEYDGFGNRTKMIDGQVETSYSFNALNQLISTADSTGNEQRYTYDKRGNLTELHKNSVLENQYQFGALNRLEQVKNHITGEGAEYRYDGFGNRVGQSVGQLNNALDINPTKHIDDIVDMTKEYNNLLMRHEGDISTSYIWDNNLLYADSGNEVQSYMLDEMGSPVRFGNEAYGYDEFGNMRQAASSTQPFGFTGYQHDPIAGTWFAQAREYDSNTGRFTAQDTHWHPENMIWGDRQAGVSPSIAPDPLAIGQSSNLYGYTMNDPVNRVDLTGNLIFTLAAITVAVVKTAVLLERERANYNEDQSLVLPQPGEDVSRWGISNYRGQIVIRSPWLNNIGNFSFSYIIGLTTNVRYDEAGKMLLSHEHGHNLQLQELGYGRWWLGIARPSMYNANRGFQPYMRQPWEIHADILAGVRRFDDIDPRNSVHTTNSLLLGLAYFHFISTAPILELEDNLMAFRRHDFSAIKEGWMFCVD